MAVPGETGSHFEPLAECGHFTVAGPWSAQDGMVLIGGLDDLEGHQGAHGAIREGLEVGRVDREPLDRADSVECMNVGGVAAINFEVGALVLWLG